MLRSVTLCDSSFSRHWGAPEGSRRPEERRVLKASWQYVRGSDVNPRHPCVSAPFGGARGLRLCQE